MLKITAPSTLISSIPAVLGFRPEKSLVVVTVTNGTLGAVMRVDLDALRPEMVERLAAAASHHAAHGAFVVVVDPNGEDRSHVQLIDGLVEALIIRGVSMMGAYVVEDITAGARWHCPDGCGFAGTLDDPAAGVLAASAVLNGRRLCRNLSELQSLVAQDANEVERVGAALRDASAMTDPRESVESAIAAARSLAEGRAPSDDELASVAVALLDKQVRDMLLAFVLTDDRRAAEDFWAMLARSLPAPWRVEALTLVATYAFARGDGVFAGIALDAALKDDASHCLAAMLGTALETGMQPASIRALAEVGYRLARERGVDLPEQVEHTA